VMAAAGLPTLARRAFGAGDPDPDFAGPYIVKPRFGGSSIGIEVADSIETARALRRNSIHFRDGAVIEPYRTDLFDLNVSYRTYPDFALSQIERPLRPDAEKIYTFADKYLNESGLQGAPREMPAKLAPDVEKTITDCARKVYDVLQATGIVRIDFLSNGTEVYVNEANTIPGAMALYLWEGSDVDRLLLDAVDEARAQFVDPMNAATTGAQGALQVAGGISSKLAGLRTEGR
jgi:D-alanine-D-alanine ligase